MPIFEYRCECGFDEDRLVKRSEMESQKCPECGALMHRLFSPQGQMFKLVFNNKTDMVDWQGNRSRYWDEHKKQREKEGKIQTTVPDMSNIK